METWLEDVVEQISISHILMESKTISGRRLAMIIVDNSVEFMLKAYGDTRLVGTVIKKNDWEKKKESFKHVLDFIMRHAKCSVDAATVFHYHNIRNALYHEALPLSVEPKKVLEYIGISLRILSDLFGAKFTGKEWKNRIKKTHVALLAKELPKLVEFARTEDRLVKVQTDLELRDTQAILLTIYGFATVVGRNPSNEELKKSLSYSGHPIRGELLGVKVAQLRKKKMINRGELSLTGSAIKQLKKRYFMPQ